ncbi:MAG: prepilin-type N-terminal cleavage/methylation domain-containing protein [bacterium]|nr:prepilin-type N-terminal cleavage/methylation domain-containing protein [bacterium]
MKRSISIMYKIQIRNMKRGFTLIELVIVIAIIGILSSIILVGLGGFRAKGRDARRTADLKQVQNGLELYFAATGAYPDKDNWDDLTNALTGANIGVNQVPNDPQSNNGASYGYCVSGGRYVLAAMLEDENNLALRQAGAAFPCDPAGVLDAGGSNEVCNTADPATTNAYCVTL